MLASFRAREARVMPATARSPQGDCGRQREQQFYSYSYYQEFDDTITISLGVCCARLHGCTRQHQHIFTSLSHPGALHALPLTTIHAASPCGQVRVRDDHPPGAAFC